MSTAEVSAKVELLGVDIPLGSCNKIAKRINDRH